MIVYICCVCVCVCICRIEILKSTMFLNKQIFAEKDLPSSIFNFNISKENQVLLYCTDNKIPSYNSEVAGYIYTAKKNTYFK